MNTPLQFSKANTKLAVLSEHLGLKKTELVSFDLPAGWSCPCANICLTRSNKDTGKLERKGPILCYAAKAEALYRNCRNMRWSNFQALTACKTDVLKMAELISTSLPKQTKVVRIHSSGDFYRPEYFQAWVAVATINPEIVFFGYTKILDYVTAPKPDNFHLIYSFGSKDDNRWDVTIPTCFIETKTEKYNVEQVCETHELGYQDYSHILSGNSFKIAVH
jgi:hypothetical protein